MVLELAHSGNHSWLVPGMTAIHSCSSIMLRKATANRPTHPTTRLRTRAIRRSFHIGGVQVVMCDGHVTFISNGIDFATYRAMYTPQGGESVSVPD